MKKQRIPYARRSVWIAVAILTVALVAVGVYAVYEIHHLNNQVAGLQKAVTTLYVASSQGK